MPSRCFQRQYEQMSQFEMGRIIGMMEAGWSDRRVAHQLDHSDSVGPLCLLEPYNGAWLKDIWDRGAHYVCCLCRPPINTSFWSGAAHEKTGQQRNGTRSSLASNPDSISAVMTIVFVSGDPVVNA
ncbi:uncharacterized protein TNCV_4240521 [Trichonephila clavipes]|nr:uncharacterized protein TNCV_4240521 [Trichonephila clavipes]